MTETLAEILAVHPHVGAHLAKSAHSEPKVVDLERSAIEADQNVLYPLGDGAYAHIHPGKEGLEYDVIEPILDAKLQADLVGIKDRIFQAAMGEAPPKTPEALEWQLLKLFDERAEVPPGPTADALKYHLVRDLARFGILQPLLRDPSLEDIQSVGTEVIHVIHRFFDMLPTNVRFRDKHHLGEFVRTLAERAGRPVSDSNPIVDATLSDGSRINIVYSEDVSRRGSSFSIRRTPERPLSITQLIRWKTVTPLSAAYLWLCLENGMSVFVCGESACGKSSTVNAILPFIDPRSKIYTAEDTPEVRPPHRVWQRLLTRETGRMESRVDTFLLLKAALRSRPNYIVVGEIRGAEGAVAFQAMQTGHPTLATFHAPDASKMIQRLATPPISVPLSFVDNLNVAVFQRAMHRDGRLIRRIVSIDEIQGYSEDDGGVVTLPVFEYETQGDDLRFTGMNNSYILESKIAEAQGYEDPKEIYDELRRRAKLLTNLAKKHIDFDEVNSLLFAYALEGIDALPADVRP